MSISALPEQPVSALVVAGAVRSQHPDDAGAVSFVAPGGPDVEIVPAAEVLDVNAARKLTPYRRLKIDPLSGVRLVV
jgi:hypothetical protein